MDFAKKQGQAKRLSAFINANGAKLSQINRSGACPLVLFEADPKIVNHMFPNHSGGPIITAFPEVKGVEAKSDTERLFIDWLNSPNRAMILIMNQGTVLFDSCPTGGLEASPVMVGDLFN